MKNSKAPTALANLAINRHFPARPAYGTQGKKILVYANYHRIEVFRLARSFDTLIGVLFPLSVHLHLALDLH
jgi:hypothetical protein